MEEIKKVYMIGDPVNNAELVFYDTKEEAREKNNQFMIEACKENNVMIPGHCFKSEDEVLNYVFKTYLEDKKTYLATNKWPERRFYLRDKTWINYHYFKINDSSINLLTYFDDFPYDIRWTRKDFINLMNKYGKDVLRDFATYALTKPLKEFDEWYKEYCEEYHLIIVNKENSEGRQL